MHDNHKIIHNIHTGTITNENKGILDMIYLFLILLLFPLPGSFDTSCPQGHLNLKLF